ncbi:MAG: hypothetical protein PHV99_02865 [Candidatus Pacebacteria bacterium]|nr:hypothetical protein [Candidatus Paceibacterota bacterium]
MATKGSLYQISQRPAYVRALYVTFAIFVASSALASWTLDGHQGFRWYQRIPPIFLSKDAAAFTLFFFGVYLMIWSRIAQSDDEKYAQKKTEQWGVPMTTLFRGDPFGRGVHYCSCLVRDCPGYLAVTNVFSQGGYKKINPLNFNRGYFERNTHNQKASLEKMAVLRSRLNGKDRCFCNVCGTEHKDSGHIAEHPLALKQVVADL